MKHKMNSMIRKVSQCGCDSKAVVEDFDVQLLSGCKAKQTR